MSVKYVELLGIAAEAEVAEGTLRKYLAGGKVLRSSKKAIEGALARTGRLHLVRQRDASDER